MACGEQPLRGVSAASNPEVNAYTRLGLDRRQGPCPPCLKVLDTEAPDSLRGLSVNAILAAEGTEALP